MTFKLAMTLAFAALIGAGIISRFERPPMDVTQIGYRGLGMEQVVNPRTQAAKLAAITVPAPIDPAAAGSPPATSEYKNVKVLTDVSVDEFNRLMLAITEWVSPEEGCGYCHNEDDLSLDDKYQKIVARRMIEMTRHINADWKDHVADLGVTCFTCHRGKPVPAMVWHDNSGPPQAGGMAARRQGQNIASETAGLTSLPYDPLKDFLAKISTPNSDAIRVVSTTALPEGNEKNIKQTEHTYSLMINMSRALGVNCTFCHNTRSFAAWDQSTPKRTPAYHGIHMVQDINMTYLEPLKATFPADRLGPHGDAPKLACGTCHQGLSRPLNGANMLKDYPSLAGGQCGSN